MKLFQIFSIFQYNQTKKIIVISSIQILLIFLLFSKAVNMDKNKYLTLHANPILNEQALKENLNKFNNQTVSLNGGRLERAPQVNQIIACIKVWNVNVLELQYNRSPSIMKDISRIEFPKIKELYLGGNEITSLQFLYQVDCAELKQLFLNNNLLHTIHGIRKVILPEINLLALQGNRINEGNELTFLRAKKMQKLRIEYFRVQSSQIYSLKDMIKLDSPSLKKLNVFSNQRLKEKNIQGMLRKKYLNIRFPTNSYGDWF